MLAKARAGAAVEVLLNKCSVKLNMSFCWCYILYIPRTSFPFIQKRVQQTWNVIQIIIFPFCYRYTVLPYLLFGKFSTNFAQCFILAQRQPVILAFFSFPVTTYTYCSQLLILFAWLSITLWNNGNIPGYVTYFDYWIHKNTMPCIISCIITIMHTCGISWMSSPLDISKCNFQNFSNCPSLVSLKLM